MRKRIHVIGNAIFVAIDHNDRTAIFIESQCFIAKIDFTTIFARVFDFLANRFGSLRHLFGMLTNQIGIELLRHHLRHSFRGLCHQCIAISDVVRFRVQIRLIEILAQRGQSLRFTQAIFHFGMQHSGERCDLTIAFRCRHHVAA